MIKEGVFLGKRYEILGRIGSGGMADVYKGKDHKLNRFVAIKVLKSTYRSDETFIKKFLSEAQAAAGLMHPNVVNVYDVGQDRGLYYMVMELVEGITLKDYIEKKGKLSAKETISISIQMVTGIQAAHNCHIIHRDIKPQNIIISKDGKVKVTDFGIAKVASTATINIIFNSESLDEMSVEEKGKYYVNGHMMEYDQNRKANIPVPVTIVIPVPEDDEKGKKKAEAFKHKFMVDDDTYKEYGAIVNMLNGAQKTEITEDMLTDEQREDLDLGIITMDDIRAEIGGNVYGDRIREYQLVKPARGFTKGRQDTVWTDEDMIIKPIEEAIPDSEDLFEDEAVDDDDDIL